MPFVQVKSYVYLRVPQVKRNFRSCYEIVVIVMCSTAIVCACCKFGTNEINWYFLSIRINHFRVLKTSEAHKIKCLRLMIEMISFTLNKIHKKEKHQANKVQFFKVITDLCVNFLQLST